MEKCGHVSSGNRKVKKKQGDHKAKKIIQKKQGLISTMDHYLMKDRKEIVIFP